MHVKLENETRFGNDESKISKTKEPTLENNETKSKKTKNQSLLPILDNKN